MAVDTGEFIMAMLNGGWSEPKPCLPKPKVSQEKIDRLNELSRVTKLKRLTKEDA